MRTIALMAVLALVAACGAKEEATPDTGKAPVTKDSTDMKKSAEVLTDKAPGDNPGSAEMRVVVLDIEGMS